ncbi:DeoR/GlpR family DNA-binding transcription regulator [Paenibacillus protaetiae]|uniref:DeoR/GlpR transcriptional regulator n=1 Tax=Paenibacillus protaetiae TaxID=2509456 RepID=A0A4P6EXG6_9BACL|nr:DeoR/GlpR family DNA-binding transcription regulator [Paenibacillus protaetiae]QAY66449.1 DeoR/GlpR transcriptional regulator [Paenibacillus protaetiae]
MLMGTRRHEIMRMLEQQNQVTIVELAEKFRVSSMTIRRDLDLLQSEGKIQRSHGGAVRIQTFAGASYEYRSQQNQPLKSAIAKEAAKHVQDGMSLILDAGSTIAALIDELEPFRHLKIITRDLNTALLLANEKRFATFDVYCTGGRLSKWAGSLDGLYTEKMLAGVTADITFSSCEAVSLVKGAMAWSPVIVGAKQAAMSAAGKNILLADSTKFGYHSFAIFSALDQFDSVITDDRLDEFEISRFRAAGLPLTVARTSL